MIAVEEDEEYEYMKSDLKSYLQQKSELLKQQFISNCKSIKTEYKYYNDADEKLLDEVFNILKIRKFMYRAKKRVQNDPNAGLFNEAELFYQNIKETQCSDSSVDSFIVNQADLKVTPGSEHEKVFLPHVIKEYRINEEQKKKYRDYKITEIGIDQSEQLYETPGQYCVFVSVVYKYKAERINTDGTIDVHTFNAYEPKEILTHSLVTSGLLSYILVNKFCNYISLQKQEAIFATAGIRLLKGTMANWVVETGKKLSVFMNKLMQYLRACPEINLGMAQLIVQESQKRCISDLSVVAIVGDGGDPKKPKVLIYHRSKNQRLDYIEKILNDYKGAIQYDLCAGFENIRRRQNQLWAGSWAVIKRKFKEVKQIIKENKELISILNYINELYKIESKLRKKYKCETKLNCDKESFINERKEITESIFTKIKMVLMDVYKKADSNSLFGIAINFTLKAWDELTAYVMSPWLTPDNSIAEQALQPFTRARKNWYVSAVTETCASEQIYSLIETAKINDVDPYYYMRYLFDKLPETHDNELEKLFPWNVDIAGIVAQYVREDALISLCAKNYKKRSLGTDYKITPVQI